MTRIGVIADIHGNLSALKIAMEILSREHVASIVVCGDMVGYGESPNECCEIVRSLKAIVVAGNHDWAVAGRTEYEYSHSSSAVQGIEYTKKVITSENLAWLERLPLVHQEKDMTFVHATPFHPEKWYYLKIGDSNHDTFWEDIRYSFENLQGRVCFVGHSHLPTIFLEYRPDHIRVITPNKSYYELSGHRAIVDVGSVGFPRDESKKASLTIYDPESGKVWFERFALS